MSRGELKQWVQQLDDSELNPNTAIVKWMREKCSKNGVRVNLETVGNFLPNVASFVRAIFSEITNRGGSEKIQKRLKRARKAAPAEASALL